MDLSSTFSAAEALKLTKTKGIPPGPPSTWDPFHP